MDLNELNKQMFEIQNDFQKSNSIKIQSQFPKQNDINFLPIKNNIDTTQIKRPVKSGEHRNDINEKMNMLNTTYFCTENTNPNSPDMLNNQSTRNASKYINNVQNTNVIKIANIKPERRDIVRSQFGNFLKKTDPFKESLDFDLERYQMLRRAGIIK